MSTWTSRAAAALPVLLLAACVGSGPRSAQLGEGAEAFFVAGPPGYCTARQAVTQTETSAFAAFARCTSGASASPILTATVGAPGSGGTLDAPAVAAFFSAPDGRRALSRAGDPDSVTVHEVLRTEDAVLIRLTDLSPGSPGEGESWRAVLTVGDRLVTLSAIGGRDAPFTREEGRILTRAFIGAILRANATSG